MEWNRLYSQTLLSVSQSQVKSQVLKVFLRVLVLVLVLVVLAECLSSRSGCHFRCCWCPFGTWRGLPTSLSPQSSGSRGTDSALKLGHQELFRRNFLHGQKTSAPTRPFGESSSCSLSLDSSSVTSHDMHDSMT